MNRPSRQQRESYGRRRPMPLRVREGRQEAGRRKKPLQDAPSWLRDGKLGVDDPKTGKYDASVRRRASQIGEHDAA